MGKEKICGYIKNYIYESKDSLYKVANLILDDESEITIVGNFMHIDEKLNYEFIGEYRTTEKYGTQFMVETYSKLEGFTRSGLISYLSSDKFYGIGPKLAANLVDTIGLNLIDDVLKDEAILDKVPALTKPKREAFIKVLKENNKSDDVYIKLYGYGLSNRAIYKLIEAYGNNAVNVIEENPYQLIDEIYGYGFKKSDALALQIGISPTSMLRIKAAIIYTINNVCYQYGFTFITISQTINTVKKLLEFNINITDELLNKAINELINDKKLIAEDERLYDRPLYKAEENVAKKLKAINSGFVKYNKEEVKNALAFVEENIKINYTPLQKEAIINSLSSKISIITGGPGTGKSTILKGILECYSKLEKKSKTSEDFILNVGLVAPTGRAAKRMEETSGYQAKTIHRALGYNYDETFMHDQSNPLSYKLLIIDEASMVDVLLLNSLLKALNNNIQIIFIGDSNQLPSVGPGNILYELIESNLFNVTSLRQIMRQAETSRIITLSQMILNERLDYRIFSEKNEIFYYDYSSDNCINGIFKILDNFIAKGGDLQNDIQILAPMYAGVAGINAINKAVQERYNKNEKMLVRDERIFKLHDKVLQLKNDRELDIMNGDIGEIIDISKSDAGESLIINFDSKIVNYNVKLLDNLTLAYAISIHKSQGSEFKYVILPILQSYQIMLKKKLIYTAVTRAKSKLIILGAVDSINYALHHEDGIRQTSLLKRLEENKNPDNLIFDKEIPFDTLGEYNMEGITPYTFMK